MKKQLAVMVLVFVVLFNGVVLATPTITLKDAEIFLTGEGMLAISQDFFNSLTDTEQEIARRLLTELNENQRFSVSEGGNLSIDSVELLPLEIRSVADAWISKEVAGLNNEIIIMGQEYQYGYFFIHLNR